MGFFKSLGKNLKKGAKWTAKSIRDPLGSLNDVTKWAGNTIGNLTGRNDSMAFSREQHAFQQEQFRWQQEQADPSNQVAGLKKAGLHPTLAAGGGGASPGGSAVGTPGNDRVSPMEQVLMAGQARLLNAEKDKLKAEAADIRSNTDLTDVETRLRRQEEGYNTAGANYDKIQAEIRKVNSDTKVNEQQIKNLADDIRNNIHNREYIIQKTLNVMAEWFAIDSKAQRERLLYAIEKEEAEWRKQAGINRPHGSFGRNVQDVTSLLFGVSNRVVAERPYGNVDYNILRTETPSPSSSGAPRTRGRNQSYSMFESQWR